jgi:hypothetical protein
MLIKALEMGVCFHRVPDFGEHERDAPFLGPLREGKNFVIWGIFCEEFERYVKSPSKQSAVSIVALLGNLEGFVYWDF